jgi:hypothetical protein
MWASRALNSQKRRFLARAATGATKLALFGDMGIYSWNAMGGLLADSRAGKIRAIKSFCTVLFCPRGASWL